MKAWYDIKTKQEILNKTVFAKVQVRFEDNFQVVVRRTIDLLSSRNRLMQPNVQMLYKQSLHIFSTISLNRVKLRV